MKRSRITALFTLILAIGGLVTALYVSNQGLGDGSELAPAYAKADNNCCYTSCSPCTDQGAWERGWWLGNTGNETPGAAPVPDSAWDVSPNHRNSDEEWLAVNAAGGVGSQAAQNVVVTVPTTSTGVTGSAAGQQMTLGELLEQEYVSGVLANSNGSYVETGSGDPVVILDGERGYIPVGSWSGEHITAGDLEAYIVRDSSGNAITGSSSGTAFGAGSLGATCTNDSQCGKSGNVQLTCESCDNGRSGACGSESAIITGRDPSDPKNGDNWACWQPGPRPTPVAACGGAGLYTVTCTGQGVKGTVCYANGFGPPVNADACGASCANGTIGNGRTCDGGAILSSGFKGCGGVGGCANVYSANGSDILAYEGSSCGAKPSCFTTPEVRTQPLTTTYPAGTVPVDPSPYSPTATPPPTPTTQPTVTCYTCVEGTANTCVGITVNGNLCPVGTTTNPTGCAEQNGGTCQNVVESVCYQCTPNTDDGQQCEQIVFTNNDGNCPTGFSPNAANCGLFDPNGQCVVYNPDNPVYLPRTAILGKQLDIIVLGMLFMAVAVVSYKAGVFDQMVHIAGIDNIVIFPSREMKSKSFESTIIEKVDQKRANDDI